ncbi:tetratricopeptide repeat protein [Aquimarina sp. AD10]|uniref:Uncharacterized protein n=1 Tax=Aquimarina aggregata TaxID=1642818 RepID=A0A163BFM2_9FLAO|nr:MULTISPECIES: tetratricopeptide repeat protein [Aquimarina]AXT61745.1 tetratricopeptide repeat protein [Aquimarina sp. AD10]KZS41345.1 hypothetical protein AWE51_21830 [Aquimarina aggregata]RKN00904.1 tetratricopeptide repeat protein [Aquimarina sp. AD10]
MRHYLILILCFQFGILFSQEETLEEAANDAKRFVATGNDVLVKEGNFPKAEGEYRKAIAKNPVDPTAKYNLANAYYNSEKYDEATIRYTEASKVTTASKAEKHKAFHNQGNTYMEQKKYKEAVEAYKNALRNNPKDDETRYNLALAKKMLEQQEQQNDQDQDNKDQNKDNKDQNEDNKDKKEGDDKEDKKGEDGENKEDQKDKGDKDEDQKNEGDKEKDEDGKPKDDQKDKGEEEKDKGKPENQKPQQVQGQLSPQQVKSLLEAMNNEEKKVQDKMNAKKVKGAKTRTEKDW